MIPCQQSTHFPKTPKGLSYPCFFFQAEDGIRDWSVTGVQTCALPILVRALLEEVRPDLVFVAGDLSDPHGTHRMCKAAVERALEGYTATRPQVWLYRGAWQEWPITQADVLVPLSQDELRSEEHTSELQSLT